MTFRVTVPPGSIFADPDIVDRDTDLDFGDEDAFAFLPGGVLGIWMQDDARVTFIPPGGWTHVSGGRRQPGRTADGAFTGHVVQHLYQAPLI